MAWYSAPLLTNTSRSAGALCIVTSGVSYYHQANPDDRVSLNSSLLKHRLVQKMSVVLSALSHLPELCHTLRVISRIPHPPCPCTWSVTTRKKGNCKAEARYPQFFHPHPNHTALPGLLEQLELGIRKASLYEVFSLCCRAFPLHPYSSSWWPLLKKGTASIKTTPQAQWLAWCLPIAFCRCQSHILSQVSRKQLAQNSTLMHSIYYRHLLSLWSSWTWASSLSRVTHPLILAVNVEECW